MQARAALQPLVRACVYCGHTYNICLDELMVKSAVGMKGALWCLMSALPPPTNQHHLAYQ